MGCRWKCWRRLGLGKGRVTGLPCTQPRRSTGHRPGFINDRPAEPETNDRFIKSPTANRHCGFCAHRCSITHVRGRSPLFNKPGEMTDAARGEKKGHGYEALALQWIFFCSLFPGLLVSAITSRALERQIQVWDIHRESNDLGEPPLDLLSCAWKIVQRNINPRL